MHSIQTIGILCGGRSVEHTVSLRSAVFITRAVKALGLACTVILIDRTGAWQHILDGDAFIAADGDAADLQSQQITPLIGVGDRHWQSVSDSSVHGRFDCVIPMMHGQNGEDGTVQGLCRMWQVPFVGPDVEDAAVTLNKIITKTVLKAHSIPVAPWVAVRLHGEDQAIAQCEAAIANIPSDWGYPLFVKASRSGSSIGVYKVEAREALLPAMLDALAVDDQVLIEPGIHAQEIECAVLIGDTVDVAGPGELVVHDTFYSYQAKCVDDSLCGLRLEAHMPEALKDTLRQVAKQACQVLDCHGLARVDFFVTEDHQYCINEVNAIPGFTSISMFPKLWAHAGVDAPALVKRMIDAASKRFASQQAKCNAALHAAKQTVAS
jgi:D-alanine-D-alanine ligase